MLARLAVARTSMGVMRGFSVGSGWGMRCVERGLGERAKRNILTGSPLAPSAVPPRPFGGLAIERHYKRSDEGPVHRMDSIRIRGARTHNLKNLNLDLPREKLIVITGLSGSVKTSPAVDTLYAEGQRRYVESLSAYARQFLQLMEKPDVDLIEGLSPAISI